MIDIINDIKLEIQEQVLDILRNMEDFEDEYVMQITEDLSYKNKKFKLLNYQEKKYVQSEIFHAIRRLDVLEALLSRENVSEIMINAYDEIYLEENGKISKSDVVFESNERYLDIIRQIVAKCNRSINGANPIVDARLENGSRINVVLEPISLNGTAVTIRRFSNKYLKMEDLIRIGSITREAADFLKKLVQAKYNIFICGGTGAGKTSFLNALSEFIPNDERIITIEDSAELVLQDNGNLVSLETRNSNVGENLEITMRDLIKASLRMRPDRIVIGEVRGSECVDMLQAMNTGQEGSLSTGHSNSAKDMLTRLETMFLFGMDINPLTIKKQLMAIDIIIHIGRLRDKSRKVLEIVELEGLKDGEIIVRSLFSFEEEGEEKGIVNGKLKRKNPLLHRRKLEMAGIEIAT